MLVRLTFLLVLVSACATETFDDTTPLLAALVGPGSAEEAGILAFLNDASTTFALLDLEVPLDRRAARNLIDRRERLRFSTIDEVDAVAYVGSVALQKILRWSWDNGWVSNASGDRDDRTQCVIFSEVVEGSGRHNKAVEIYNCGSESVALNRIGVCLVQNDDTDCSASRSAGSRSLAPGAVWVMCKSRSGAVSDPYPPLVDACQSEIGSAANFNGDDRMVLFHDLQGDGRLNAEDSVLDTFGDTTTRPDATIWAEHGFQRCDFEPFVSGAFDVDAHYTRHPSTFTNLGVPPTPTCGATAPLAGEGAACLASECCGAGLRCFGIPRDGSSSYGRCVDPTPGRGEGARCDRFTQCDDELVCAGWTLWGEGNCVPTWMARRWTNEVRLPIHDSPSGGLSPWIVVEGLASVPVDIEVIVHLEHPRLTDLKITLIDPNGDRAVLWDRSIELEEWSRSFVTTGISRDDQVNGRWSLHVRDMVTGESGVFHEWTLYLVSRWD
ncbi:MAG: proprotein convertase P-domain-containing protein [Polyangiales bacterium]